MHSSHQTAKHHISDTFYNCYLSSFQAHNFVAHYYKIVIIFSEKKSFTFYRQKMRFSFWVVEISPDK